VNKLTATLSEWKAVSKNTLKGFCTLHIAEMRLSIRDVAVHERGGKRWAQLPARPQLDRNQQLIRNSDGKLEYASLMSWDSRAVADAFSARVVEAVLEHTPTAFKQEEPAI
jgi:hypothetical protein